MNPESKAPDPKSSPVVKRAQRWNIVWVVPTVALLLGIWLLYRNFATHGPVATIRFETAEEIYAEKTEVRCRSVKVGTVKKVELADDLSSVNVTIELDPGMESLLRMDTRFWVVKPRLSAAEISGLGTLIQGSYIELDPGFADSPSRRNYEGLEKPPATNSSVPGLRIELTTDQAGLLKSGAPIYYRGFEVGRIEDRQLSSDGGQVIYQAFISAEFSHLVCRNTRFWNTSGVEINAGSQGIVLRTPSLEAMISGGVSFGRTAGMPAGKPSQDGMRFTLFNDRETATQSAFNPTLRFLLLFDQTVRGLTSGSAVEFRGIPVGRISRISYDLVEPPHDARIPVLVEIDPKRVRPEGAEQAGSSDIDFLKQEIAKGLRASLRTTSLITNASHIDFDYFPEAAPAALGKAGEFITFPTVASGFARMETQLASLIDKLDRLPIEATVSAVTEAANEAKTMAAAARKLIEDPAFKDLPEDLRSAIDKLQLAADSIGPNGTLQGDISQTLEGLRETLKSFKAVADLLEEKPNALIFGRKDDDGKRDGDAQQGGGRSRSGPPHRH